MTCVQIVLPDQLAEQAREAGLLEPERIEEMIRAQLRREAWAELEKARLRMEERDGTPPMSLDEISEEVRAVRRAKSSR